MMDLVTFTKVIKCAQAFDAEVDKWVDILKIDIFENPLHNNYWELLDIFLHYNFDEEDIDLIYWWMFEKEFGTRDDINMYEDDEVIPCTTITELYDLISK